MKNIVRKCILAIAAVILLLPATQNAHAATGKIKVLLDGKEIALASSPLEENGRVLVPFFGIGEAMDYKTEETKFDDGERWFTLSSKPGKPEKLITIFKASDYEWAKIDGYTADLDAPLKMVNNKPFVPIQFIAKSTGAEVVWDKNAHAVKITSPLKLPLLRGKTADTEFSLLKGRLSVRMPKGSVDEEVSYGGIMGTNADSAEETMISLSANQQELVAHVLELFKYSSGDLLKDAKTFVKDSAEGGAGFTLSEVRSASNIQYIVMTPNMIAAAGSGSRSLLKGALIRLADNTLVYLSVYADRGALTYEKDCVSMADSVIKSVQGGKRLLDAGSGTVRLWGYSMNLEKGYVYTIDSGEDFDVCRFRKLVTIGEEQPYFGIYNGGDPSKFGSKLPNHTQKADTILGRDVTWDIYTSEKAVTDKDTFRETIVKHKGWDNHIFAQPKSQSDWKIIERMIHSFKEV